MNDDPSSSGCIYLDALNREQADCRLPKRETMILFSGYSVALRDLEATAPSGPVDGAEKPSIAWSFPAIEIATKVDFGTRMDRAFAMNREGLPAFRHLPLP